MTFKNTNSNKSRNFIYFHHIYENRVAHILSLLHFLKNFPLAPRKNLDEVYKTSSEHTICMKMDFTNFYLIYLYYIRTEKSTHKFTLSVYG